MYYGGLSCRNHRVLKRLHPPMAHHPVRRDALVRVHLHSCQLSRRPSPFNKHRQNSQPDVACNRSAATQDFAPRRSLTKLKSLTTALDCDCSEYNYSRVDDASSPHSGCHERGSAASSSHSWQLHGPASLPRRGGCYRPPEGNIRPESSSITVTDCAFDDTTPRFKFAVRLQPLT